MLNVKTIGIILETKEDAIKAKTDNIYDLYHWREPEEIEAIRSAIENIGYNTVILGTPKNFFDNMDRLKSQVDFLFNLSVGFKSRYRLALAPSLYELTGLPYSGADPYTKMVSQNKHLMKSFWDKINIPTPEWIYADEGTDLETIKLPDFPVIVKPAYEGSSIGVNSDSVLYKRTDVLEKIQMILNTLKMPVIVERFISGKEYKVGVIGNREKKFIGIIEDIYSDGSSLGDKFLYFNAKTTGSFSKAARDKNLPEFARLLKDCERIYNMFLPVDYGTFDIRVDEIGNYYFLEFNADATLHPKRTLAQCCELNGLHFDETIKKILQTSFERWRIYI